jgi:hypothetical protein
MSSPNTSGTTTTTDPTKPDNNDHPNPTISLTERMKPTPTRCYEPASSTDSSTNTATRLDMQRRLFKRYRLRVMVTSALDASQA